MAEMEYKGHKIIVTPEFKFRVTGPEFNEGGRIGNFEYVSKDEAVKAVDTRVALADKQRIAENTVKMPALKGATVEPFTVRGINRSTSEILGFPVTRIEGLGRYLDDIYPDVPWIKKLLEERRKLAERVGEIEEQLRPYGLRNSAGFGRVSPERYESTLQGFIDEFNKKKAAAEAAAPTE